MLHSFPAQGGEQLDTRCFASLTPRPIRLANDRLRLVPASRSRCVAVAVYAGGVLLALVGGFDAAHLWQDQARAAGVEWAAWWGAGG